MQRTTINSHPSSLSKRGTLQKTSAGTGVFPPRCAHSSSLDGSAHTDNPFICFVSVSCRALTDLPFFSVKPKAPVCAGVLQSCEPEYLVSIHGIIPHLVLSICTAVAGRRALCFPLQQFLFGMRCMECICDCFGSTCSVRGLLFDVDLDQCSLLTPRHHQQPDALQVRPLHQWRARMWASCGSCSM